ncbi:MAG: hypothetical protein BRD29_03400 [Bacteroidetes bacterium QH_2_67_10]|nr:MAG: hypothetical protein BRD29_03400 [Bacteroidetes bacterium QH_2_67_10]
MNACFARVRALTMRPRRVFRSKESSRPVKAFPWPRLKRGTAPESARIPSGGPTARSLFWLKSICTS